MSPARVFYVYAQEDEKLRQELEKHLNGMKRSGLIDTWYDRKLQANINWEREIDPHLESADIIVFLISEDFIVSGYTSGLEMKRALERYDSEGTHVIPVLLRPVDWQETPFKHISLLPTGGMSVTEWRQRDAAFLDIAKGIKKAVTAISISSLASRELSISDQNQRTETVVSIERTIPEKYINTIQPVYKQVTVKEIAKWLEMRMQSNRPIVLILGSSAGKLYHSKHFFETLQMFSLLSFSKLSRSEQFAECFSILTKAQFSEAEMHTFLEAALQVSITTAADVSLAELVSQGYFDEIITTNIDNALEDALYTIEMKEFRKFERFIPSENPQQFQEDRRNTPIRIIKVWGDFSSRSYTIRNRASSMNNNLALKSFLQRTLARDILVVGIDPIWDEEILRLIPESANAMIFVNEEDPTRHELISNLLQKRQAQYILASYDEFMRELHYNLYGMANPLSYQLNRDILNQLNDVARQLVTLQNRSEDFIDEIRQLRDEYRDALKEIKYLKQEIKNLAPE